MRSVQQSTIKSLTIMCTSSWYLVTHFPTLTKFTSIKEPDLDLLYMLNVTRQLWLRIGDIFKKIKDRICCVSNLCDAGTSKSHYNGHDVDSKLELKKLGDAVVDITAPHHCLDDAAEVIIGQNDI